MERTLEIKSLKRILVCPDSFKGSLSAKEASECIERGIRKCGFEGEIDCCPLSDGGEGFYEIIRNNKPVKKVNVEAVDALGRLLSSEYLIEEDGKIAYIESAATIGIEKLKPSERNPFKTSSFGLGLMIKDAICKGIKDIYISLGGSATVDCGMGMLTALGMQFKNKEGNLLAGNGSDMIQISGIGFDHLDKRLPSIKFHAVCDVVNPLLGETGAVNIFAPQKGAKQDELPSLETGMKNCCDTLVKYGLSNYEDRYLKGAGAAGGLGFALQSVMKADYIPGIEFIKKVVDLNEKIRSSDLVVTGEGCIDRQSLMGKVLSGVLKDAKENDVPVIAFGGIVKNHEILSASGLKAIAISDKSASLEENLSKQKAMENLENSVKKAFFKL